MNQQSSSPPPFYFGAIFALVGFVAVCWGLSIVIRASGSNSWASTQGRVIRSEVKVHRGGGGPEDSTTYIADVAYDYSVGDATYTSDRIRFGEFATNVRSTAEHWVNRFEVGAPVTVFYNPGDPTEAVLERGLSASSLLPLGAGLFFLVLGVALLAWRFRHSTPKSPSRAFEIERPDPNRLVIRYRSRPLLALGCAIPGIPLALFGLAALIATAAELSTRGREDRSALFSGLIICFFIFMGGVALLGTAVNLLKKQEYVLDSKVRRIDLKRSSLFRTHVISYSCDDFDSIGWVKVTRTERYHESTGSYGQTATRTREVEEFPVRLRGQSTRQIVVLHLCQTREEARELTHLVGGFFDLDRGDPDER